MLSLPHYKFVKPFVGLSLSRLPAGAARTLRATAAAVGTGAVRGAWGPARTVRARTAAVGPGAVRGAWGGAWHGLGEREAGRRCTECYKR